MSIVNREKWLKEGRALSVDEEVKLDAMERQLIAQFDAESTAFAASARLFDDGLIDPRDTRRVLGYCLSICRDARERKVFTSSFGVARF
jgi:geranyl-CoA carboxylase beta subunit